MAGSTFGRSSSDLKKFRANFSTSRLLLGLRRRFLSIAVAGNCRQWQNATFAPQIEAPFRSSDEENSAESFAEPGDSASGGPRQQTEQFRNVVLDKKKRKRLVMLSFL